jgi:dihydrofolate reductase
LVGVFQNDAQAILAGGAEIYTLGLPYCQRLILTLVQAEVIGDTYFKWEQTEWQKIIELPYGADERNQYPVILQEYVRLGNDIDTSYLKAHDLL